MNKLLHVVLVGSEQISVALNALPIANLEIRLVTAAEELEDGFASADLGIIDMTTEIGQQAAVKLQAWRDEFPMVFLIDEHASQTEIKLSMFHEVITKPIDVVSLKESLNRLVKIGAMRSREKVLQRYIEDGYCVFKMLFDEQGKPEDYVFLDTNLAFERHTGLKNVIGKRIKDLAPLHEQHWFDTYGKVARTRKSVKFTNYARELHRWFEVYAFPVDHETSNNVAAIFSDITEQNIAKQAYALTRAELATANADLAKVNSDLAKANGDLAKANADLAKVNEALEESKTALEQKVLERTEELQVAMNEAIEANRHKTQFVTNLSHELRTPMSSVLGFSELIQSELMDKYPDEAELHEYVQRIIKSGSEMMRLVTDLLDVAKLEANRIDVVLESCRVDLAITEVINSAQEFAQSKKLAISTSIDDALSEPIVSDELRIKQVLTNLLQNAIKFTDTGKIEIIARAVRGAREDLIRVEVTDTGCGISPKDQNNIFKPFVQADGTSTRRHGGTGIGLHICKQIVELMGGEIGVESKVGTGTTFWFTIPHPKEKIAFRTSA